MAYTFIFLTFPSNLPLPSSGRMALFSVRGKRDENTTAEFDLSLVRTSSDQNVKIVTQETFSVVENSTEAIVHVVESILGPQEFELELKTSVFEENRLITVLAHRLIVHVSQYEF